MEEALTAMMNAHGDARQADRVVILPSPDSVVDAIISSSTATAETTPRDAELAAEFWELDDALCERPRPSLARIRRIVESRPNAVRCVAQPSGWTVLHAAASYESLPGDVVGYLARQNSAAAALQVQLLNGGYTPLHLAVALGKPLLVVVALTEGCRGALLARTSKGSTPLDLAVETGAPMEVVSALAMAEPRAILEANHHNDRTLPLPLHTAVILRSPLDVVQLLTVIQPGALQVRGPNGAIPFLLAASYATLPVVQFLLDFQPPALHERCAHGLSALHYAAGTNSVEVVEFLLDRDPDGLRETSKDGSLPIHGSAISNTPQVLQLVLDRHPEAVKVAELGSGRIPLHWAAHSGNLTKVKMLVAAYPDGVHASDLEGRFPVHLAAQPRDYDPTPDLERLSTIFFLLTKWPVAICRRRRHLLAPPTT